MFLRNEATQADPSLVWSPPFPGRSRAPVCFKTVRSAVLRMIRPKRTLSILPLLPRHQAGRGQDLQGLGTEMNLETNMGMMAVNSDELRLTEPFQFFNSSQAPPGSCLTFALVTGLCRLYRRPVQRQLHSNVLS